MKKSTLHDSLRTVGAAALALVIFTTTAVAAWQLLSPAEVADTLDHIVLAEAFRSEDAIVLNETQSQNGYEVTVHGIASGSGLTVYDETIDREKSYVVVSIAKENGAMPDTGDEAYDSEPFFISPLIRGQNPWQYNIATMNGAYGAFVEGGVMYRLIECDSLEMFADRGLLLIVSSTQFYDINAYNYDETTGIVTPNQSFEGVNLVFNLPLETANADEEKARQYLEAIFAGEDMAGEDGAAPAEDTSVEHVEIREGASEQ